MGIHGEVTRFKRGGEYLVSKQFFDYSKLSKDMPNPEGLLKRSYFLLTELKNLGASTSKLKTITVDYSSDKLILSDLSLGGRHKIVDFMKVFDTKTKVLQKQFRNCNTLLETVMKDMGLMHKNKLIPGAADLWVIAKKHNFGGIVLVDPLMIHNEKDVKRKRPWKAGVLSWLLGHLIDDVKLVVSLMNTYRSQNPEKRVINTTLDYLSEDETHAEMVGWVTKAKKLKLVDSIRNQLAAAQDLKKR